MIPPPAALAGPAVRQDPVRRDPVRQEADTDREGRRFGEWLDRAERSPVIEEDKPLRQESPDEDPQALLAELVPPWLAQPTAAARAAAAAPPEGAEATGQQAPEPAADAPEPAAGGEGGEADQEPLFEVEVELEPPRHTARQTEPPRASARLAGPAAEAAEPAPAAEHKLQPDAPSEPPPAPEIREHVPVLKHVRVRVDSQLSLEVSPADTDSVEVRLDGTPAALRSMAGLERELRDNLHSGGFHLGGFSSSEREAEHAEEPERARGRDSEPAGAAIDAAEAPRRAAHTGLVETVA